MSMFSSLTGTPTRDSRLGGAVRPASTIINFAEQKLREAAQSNLGTLELKDARDGLYEARRQLTDTMPVAASKPALAQLQQLNKRVDRALGEMQSREDQQLDMLMRESDAKHVTRMAGYKAPSVAPSVPKAGAMPAMAVGWDMVMGLDAAKKQIRESVVAPLKWPQLFVAKGFQPCTGILLYGPPGTGKTMIAKAVAAEAGATFFCVTAADIMNEYVGASEKAVKDLFALARAEKRSVIFIDECDNIMGARTSGDNDVNQRVVTELLNAMDGFDTTPNVAVLGATNRPDSLDPAVLRRFKVHIQIPPPDAQARATMFANKARMLPQAQWDGHVWQRYAAQTEGASGADITNILKDAAATARSRITTSKHFYDADDGTTYPCDITTCSPDIAHVAYACPDDPSGLTLKLQVTPHDIAAAIARHAQGFEMAAASRPSQTPR